MQLKPIREPRKEQLQTEGLNCRNETLSISHAKNYEGRRIVKINTECLY